MEQSRFRSSWPAPGQTIQPFAHPLISLLQQEVPIQTVTCRTRKLPRGSLFNLFISSINLTIAGFCFTIISVSQCLYNLPQKQGVRSLRICGATTAGCLETGPRIPSLLLPPPTLAWNPSYTALSPYNPLVQPTCIFDVSIQFIPISLPNPYQPINRLVHLVLHSTIFVGTTHRFELMIGDEHV